MKILISVIVAYLITGIAKASKDIFSRPIDRPSWAIQPKLGMTLLVIFIWPLIGIQENIHIAKGNVARGIAFGLMGSLFQVLIIGLFVWVFISVIGYLFGLFE